MMAEVSDNVANDSTCVNINVKTPKRIVHYGDCVVEEYSEDESDSCQKSEDEPQVDPSTLPWIPWFNYKFWSAGNRTLSIIDYVGETLAYILGITAPKYQLEINEYNRMQEKLKKSQEEEKGWIANEDGITTNQPSVNAVSTV